MRAIVLILIGAALAGCATERMAQYRNSNNPRAGQTDLNRDHYQCTKENTQTRYIYFAGVFGPDQYTDDDMVNSCLAARGWRIVGYKQ